MSPAEDSRIKQFLKGGQQHLIPWNKIEPTHLVLSRDNPKQGPVVKTRLSFSKGGSEAKALLPPKEKLFKN